LFTHPGCVEPVIEHRQKITRVILKGLSVFKIVKEYWPHLKVTSCIASK
jgi:hypothetical protein